jgi:predicted ArsR family transcriptional regulator
MIKTKRKDEEKDTLQKTIIKIQKLIGDPTRVMIWFEIFRNPSITAKKLMQVVDIQKTAMYYHLKNLEEESLISSTQVKGINHYQITTNFFTFFENKDIDFSEGKIDKISRLFNLYITNALVQREIRRVAVASETALKQTKYPISHTALWFCKKERLEMVKNEYEKLKQKIIQIDEGSEGDSIEQADYSYYWGVIDFTE